MKMRTATDEENDLHAVEATEVAKDLERIGREQGGSAVIVSIDARIFGSVAVMGAMGYSRAQVLEIVESIATKAFSLYERAKHGGGNA